jgi:hypothetical protein
VDRHLHFHPQPKQRKVLDLLRALGPDVATIIGFGGARGGAKSRLIRDAALILALQEPGITVWIVMRNWGKLEEQHWQKYAIERPEIMQYWHGGRKQFELPAEMRGSRIAMKYADTEEEVEELARGPECKYLIIDQAEQFSEKQLRKLKTCNRWTGQGAQPGGAKMLLSFNPGGPGTAYLRRVMWLRQFEGDETPASFVFVQAFGWDNYEWFRNDCPEWSWEEFYRLPDEVRFEAFIRRTSYGREIWQLPEQERLGELYGRFDVFRGQYFAGVWDERRSTLSDRQVRELIAYWHVRWMSMDWGFRHHAAVFWFAALKASPADLERVLGIRSDWPLDLVICYRELVVEQMAEHDLAKRILALTPHDERARMQQFRAGTDIFAQRRGIEHTIAEQIESVTCPGGLPAFSPADTGPGSRVQSARMVHDGFRRSSSMRSPNPPQDLQPTPLLLIGPECPILQASIPMLIADENKLEDVLKLETMEDDVFDGFKYGVGYYHDALGRAPVEVRRAEVFNRYEGEHTEESRTAQAMAMRKFNQAARRETQRVIRRR